MKPPCALDADGNDVFVGDVVRVLAIAPDFLDHALSDDERLHHRAMLHQDYVVDEILEDGAKASVSIQWPCAEGVAICGLALLPHECRLVRRSRLVTLPRAQLSAESIAAHGERAARLLIAGDLAELTAQYGYALALGLGRVEAVRADTLAALAASGATGFTHSAPMATRVSYFPHGECGLYALVECDIPVDSGATIRLELIVSGDEPLYATLEQISGHTPLS